MYILIFVDGNYVLILTQNVSYSPKYQGSNLNLCQKEKILLNISCDINTIDVVINHRLKKVSYCFS